VRGSVSNGMGGFHWAEDTHNATHITMILRGPRRTYAVARDLQVVESMG